MHCTIGLTGFVRLGIREMTLIASKGSSARVWRLRCLLLVLLAITATYLAPYSIAQTRQITQLKGDIYRFQNNHHYSVFVVTSAGVLVTDPINASAAQWLKSEIATMTDQPITHLVYSHSHADHASGGLAFGDELTVVAQQNAPATIDGVAPTVRVNENHSFELGGKTIELTALGPGHGDDLMAMIIRPENVLFVVDAVAAKRLPYRDFPGVDVDGLAVQIDKVASLDFDLMAPGHGATGSLNDVKLQADYLRELTEAVRQAMRQGLMGEQLVMAVPMQAYRDWGAYDRWHALNVRGMERWLAAGPTQ
ncbi:MAG: MBL fold metallo-hydrolase [Burkholderiaceae bacterium]